MPRAFPLSSLLLKASKTTILIPVSSATTLSTLRTTLLEALRSTTPTAQADDPDLPTLPEDAKDIALWRLEQTPEGEEDKWVRLTDEKSGADKWGVNESDEIGVSFKASDGTFPTPSVVRPVDDYEEQ
ncbi:hypothetical protein JCM11641_003043 [Rhodosporidiobolus odoratus]